MRLLISHKKLDGSASKSMKQLADNPSFKKGILAIRNKYAERSFRDEYHLIEDPDVRRDLDDLRIHMDKDDSWLFFFAYYLYHRKLPDHFNPRLPFIETEDVQVAREKTVRYNLRLAPNTTLRDVSNSWKQIKSIISTKTTKDRRYARHSVDIIMAWRDGKNPLEIKNIIKTRYGKILTVKEVEAIIHRMRDVYH